MDAPPSIRYARTEDGVDLAYWTIGDGPHLIHTPLEPSHALLEWDFPAWRAWYEALAEHFTVVKYDTRGLGLSSQGVRDYSLDALTADIGTIAAAVGIEQFILWGSYAQGPAAIAFAERFPNRVAQLVLWCSFASGKDNLTAPALSTVVRSAEGDWETFHRLLAASDNLSTEFAAHYARQMRTGSQDDWLAWLGGMSDHDVTKVLPDVQAPTLVLHQRDCPVAPLEHGRELAARIPDSRLSIVSGESGYPFLDSPETLDVLLDFLGASAASPGATPTGFRTLLFTDLESSTALTQAVGDEKAQKVLDGHDTAVRAALAANGGEEVKHLGDGIFAAFASAVSAVEAALQIQRELAGAEVRVRVGLNAGEPIAKDDDYFGAAVQLAARVCDRAEPGQVLVSNVVKELCTGKLFQFEDQGEVTLKGFREPVRLFVVGGDVDDEPDTA